MSCCFIHPPSGQLLQTFSDLYSSYCDCGKFVRWLDESLYLKQAEKNKEEEGQYAWFISRGAELCDVSEGVCKYRLKKKKKHIS